MIANYHTHTARCNHAVGTDRQYVESAIQSGMQILGFSDHAPLPWQAVSGMSPAQLPDYIASLTALRQEFHSQLTLHIGAEVEYNPDTFSCQLDYLGSNGIEYLILGQHYLYGIEGCPAMGTPTASEAHLARHCELTIAAAETGAFSYIAHPDCLNFTGPDSVYERHIRALCHQAVHLSIPLEINFLGLRTHRHYPRDLFWAIAGEEGCEVVFGCDAHEPWALAETTAPATAQAMTKRYHLHLLPTIPLRSLSCK